MKRKTLLFLLLFFIAGSTSAQSLPPLPDSLQKKIKTAPPDVLPWLLLQAGNFYFSTSNYEGYDKALDYYRQAEHTARKNNDTIAVANAYLEMANLYDNVGLQLDKALEYYNNYLAQVQFTKDTAVFIRQHMNIASTLLRLGRNAACKDEIEKLTTLAKQYGHISINNKALIMAAQLYMEMNDAAAVQKYFTQIDTSVKIKNELLPYKRHYIITKAWLQHNAGNTTQAIKLCTNLLAECRNKYDSLYIMDILAKYYGQVNDYKQALFFVKTAEKINAQIVNEKALQSVSVKMWQADAQLKGENAALLQKQKRQQQKFTYGLLAGLLLMAALTAVIFRFALQRRKQNKILQLQNEEKVMLLGEIHHRVKNNLEMLQSMLLLQMREYKDDENVQTALGEANNRIQSIALLHKQLYSGNLAKTNACYYFAEMLNRVLSSFNSRRGLPIKHQLLCADVEMQPDTILPLALLINEWLTNSVKYAFEKEQTDAVIVLQIQQLQNELLIMYSDNGTGTAADNNAGTGFGSRLITSLVKQLRGNLILDKKEIGWHYKLALPLNV